MSDPVWLPLGGEEHIYYRDEGPYLTRYGVDLTLNKTEPEVIHDHGCTSESLDMARRERDSLMEIESWRLAHPTE